MGGVNLGDWYWAGSGLSLGLPTRAKLLNLTHIKLFITAQLLYMTGFRIHPIIWAPAGTAPLTKVSSFYNFDLCNFKKLFLLAEKVIDPKGHLS